MDLVEITTNPNRHPWEISRTKNLVNQCFKMLKKEKCVHICDIGAGDRYFEKQLIPKFIANNIQPMIYAVDINYHDLCSDSDFIQLHRDLSTIKRNKMDFIVMMDVLEHVEDDLIFLRKVTDHLKESGLVLITVPAHSSLFSSHDKFLKHYRRYDKENLESLIKECNLSIQQCHYFYTSLFIVRWFQVKLTKEKPIHESVGIGLWKYSAKSIVTKVFVFILNLDFSVNSYLNHIGIKLPGLSLLCVAKK